MYFYSGVSNYRETPYIISDDYANIGNYAATIKGSVYIARDGASLSVASIYQANGTSWVAIGSSVTAAASSLQAVTTVGNTSNQGIVVTANGISTNSVTNTGLTAKSIPFVGTGGLISQDNTNFVWDNTNKWLGIQTNTPTSELDLHSTTTTPMIALNNTAGNASNILFQNTNVSKFRLGNNAANNFVLFNNTLASTAFFVAGANNNFLLGSTTDDTVSKLQVTGNSAFTANVTAGTSFSFTTNQTNTNVTDTADGSVLINNNLTGTGATNELVLRALTVGSTNSRTGGTVLINQRSIDIISGTLASTTTTNLDQVYLSADTVALGTVTNSRGVTVKTMQGTSQAAFVTSTLTSTNRSGLFIGGYTLPSGAWSIYSSVTDSASFLGRMVIGSNTDDTVNKLQVTGTSVITGILTLNNATKTISTGLSDLYIAINDISPYSGLRNVVIGSYSNIFTNSRNVAIGVPTITPSAGGVVQIGNVTSVTGTSGIAIGSNTTAVDNSISIGNTATVTATGCINICGTQFSAGRATLTNTYCFNLGTSHRSESSASNQGILNATSIYIGRPARATSTLGDTQDGVATSFNGMGGYAKTDAIGGNLTINGGVGLGAGASGDLIFGTATPTTTGTTVQTLTNRWWIKNTIGTFANVTSPNASAALQVDATTQGFLPPRLTTTQKNAIATPGTGLILYDSTLNKLCIYTGAAWETVTSI